MDVGVVTFQESSNYGAVMQAYALQTALSNMGHTAFFPPVVISIEHRKGLRKFIGRSVLSTFEKWTEIVKFLAFENFRRRHLSRGIRPRRMLAQSFLDCPVCLPAYITGSDQVWNPFFLPTGSADRHLFWLDFLGENVRRISYAASFGVTDLPASDRTELTRFLKRFDAISVREESAVSLVAELGRHATWVCDPTCLLDAADYNSILSTPLRQNPSSIYMYEYFLKLPVQVPPLTVRRIIQRELDCRVLAVFPTRLIHDAFVGCWDSPQKWVQHIANARFVLTNSFHCTVMCILFRRPFIVVPLGGDACKRNSRIVSFLSRLGLTKRILDKNDEKTVVRLINEPIDWDGTHVKLSRWREESLAFLAQALQ